MVVDFLEAATCKRSAADLKSLSNSRGKRHEQGHRSGERTARSAARRQKFPVGDDHWRGCMDKLPAQSVYRLAACAVHT
jgi:hypothetical protein